MLEEYSSIDLACLQTWQQTLHQTFKKTFVIIKVTKIISYYKNLWKRILIFISSDIYYLHDLWN